MTTPNYREQAGAWLKERGLDTVTFPADEQSLASWASRIAEEERAKRDAVYRERDQVVALLARMANDSGWRAGLRSHEPDPDPTWDEDWKNVVAIDLPSGQVTWHFHDSERHLFHSLPAYPASWDGHSTDEKYRRVNEALAGARVSGGTKRPSES